LGVYVTTNAGINWNEYMSGMPYALVFDLTVVYPNRKIRATTHGNGVYERKLLENPVSVNASDRTLEKNFRLFQNFPNPFNPETKINYELLSDAKIVMRIYDINGKELLTLLNEKQSPGLHTVNFSGKNLTSGVYFYKLTATSLNSSLTFSETRKMLLVK
ncbi:MAG: T9SS type A sorting domain-containing protein, partial [Bacteroidetes bacterium]|nr:T9SS type A sorting domain-containing protein [Bacteroidota bacterium]